jgi:hypothetical protein
MDENEFFRQATLRICGNLEIEEAIQRLLLYLKKFMPADLLFLQKLDNDYNAMRTIARKLHRKTFQMARAPVNYWR